VSGLLANMWDWAVFVLLFGVTIFVHELGHFLTALWTGMKVDTFSLGFGPAIWKKKARGITFKIGCIPVGGYVSIPQLDPGAMSAIQGRVEESDGGAHQASEASPAPWKKILVVTAGGAGNVAFAVLAAWIIYLSPFVPDEGRGTAIGYVATNSVAYVRGIRPGDVIVAVNGNPVSTWYDYTVECMLGKGRKSEVSVTVRRDGRTLSYALPVTDQGGGYYTVDGIVKSSECVILDVMAGSPAEAAGFRTNDIVRTFDGVRVAGPGHFVLLVAEQGEREAVVVVERGGKEVELRVTPRFDEKLGRTIIGVRPGEGGSVASPWMHHKRPWHQIRSDALRIKRFLVALVTPGEARPAAEGVGGPVVVFLGLWAAVRQSLLNAVGFARFLNINLAIINLPPLPVLDGGHVVFALWECVTRRRVPAKLANALVNAFAVLLVGVFIVLTYRDILRVRVWKRLREAAVAAQESAATNAVQDVEQEHRP